jgi:hypothetical protein
VPVGRYIAFASLLLSALSPGGAARAADILFNDGMPHVIDDGAYADEDVVVRNVGCPPTLEDPKWHPCPEPWGPPTALSLAEGGSVYELYARETSTVTVSGGEALSGLRARNSSTVALTGGAVKVLDCSMSSSATVSSGTIHSIHTASFATVTVSGGDVRFVTSFNWSRVTLSGGSRLAMLEAKGSSVITLVGSGFAVDGVPVPYGDLAAPTGFLTGTLASGDRLNETLFYQGGGSYTGTIRLVPLPGE